MKKPFEEITLRHEIIEILSNSIVRKTINCCLTAQQIYDRLSDESKKWLINESKKDYFSPVSQVAQFASVLHNVEIVGFFDIEGLNLTIDETSKVQGHEVCSLFRIK